MAHGPKFTLQFTFSLQLSKMNCKRECKISTIRLLKRRLATIHLYMIRPLVQLSYYIFIYSRFLSSSALFDQTINILYIAFIFYTDQNMTIQSLQIEELAMN